MEALLEVRHLVVRFESREAGTGSVAVVRGVDLTIHPGETVGLLGESGCGKTTTALALLRLLPPSAKISAGSIRWTGREMLTLPERRLRMVRGAEIAWIPQDPDAALNPVLRVGAQISEVLRVHRQWNRVQSRKEAEKLLRRLGLSDVERIYRAYPHQLSGGQRQRVAIARAIACRPALLIADEPASALDTSLQVEFLSLLQSLKESMGMAMLLISHRPALLAGLADKLMVIYAGQVVETGPAAEVLRTPLHPYTKGLLQSMPASAELAQTEGLRTLPVIAGSPPDPAALPAGCCFEPRCPDRMEDCRSESPVELWPEPRRSVRCFKYGK